MNTSRRSFLNSALSLSAFGALQNLRPGIAWAESSENQDDSFFVLIRIDGGWDVTLGLDPWLFSKRPRETDMFIEYRHDELIQADSMVLGPAAKALAPYANDFMVINGVLMSEFDNGHIAAMNYISTGNGQGKAPDLPVEVALSTKMAPYGIVTSWGLNLANRRATYTRANDIHNSRLKPDPAESLKSIRHDNRTPLERAIDGVVNSQQITQDLRKALDQLAPISGGNDTDLLNEKVIAASFLSGASRQSITTFFPNPFIDTHASHEGNHLMGLKQSFTYLANVFSLFKSLPYGTRGESLFDRTTFMVVSEFARTPALNGAQGKDHNPMTNSVLLAGKGIRTNQVVNKSLLIEAERSKYGSSYHMASPFDFATGLPATGRDGADFIYPENVALTVAMACGCDLSKFKSVPKHMKPVTGVLD